MPVIAYNQPLSILVVARGHPYDRTAFMAAFDAMPGICASLVEQPAAARLMSPDNLHGIDALVLYDMPGLDFSADTPPGYVAPDADFRANVEALLQAGKPIVALHHAIAGWPAWPRWAEILGGAFLYKPGQLRGIACADGGYHHDVRYTAEVIDPAHPVLRGLPRTFEITDELYLYECFDQDIVPLIRARHGFTDRQFYSAARAVSGRMYDNDGWHRPSGTDLICWAKRAGNSPVVYIQPGDGVSAYDNPHWRQLVRNAIDWVVSPEARAFVRNLRAA